MGELVDRERQEQEERDQGDRRDGMVRNEHEGDPSG
jgi:hypothetical protein